MLRGRGTPFNINCINNNLLILLENQVRDNDHEDMRRITMDTQKQMDELQRLVSVSLNTIKTVT